MTAVRLLALALAVLLALLAWLQLRIGRETVGEVRALEPAGAHDARRALVIYNPGLSDFQRSLALAFARGLADAGWRVDTTTTSQRTPATPGNYDLLAIGTNTYWWAPDPPTRRYLARARLGGLPVVVLASGSGQAERALARTEARVEDAGGRVIRALALYSWRPNDETRLREPNKRVAQDLAYRAGNALTPP